MGCKRPPQVQCFHCSKPVCIECAQNHATQTQQQIDGVQDLVNQKLEVLDRIAKARQQNILAEYNKVLQQAGVARDRAITQLNQLIDQEKQEVRKMNQKFQELRPDQVPAQIQKVTTNVKHLTDNNTVLFCVSSSPPDINVTHPRSTSVDLSLRLASPY